MAAKNKKSIGFRLVVALFTLVSVLIFSAIFVVFNDDEYRGKTLDLLEQNGAPVELEIPEEFISVYKKAADEYGVDWRLLAAHHRVETRFSTMDTLVSPVGAEGHMQFMPCTFIGWSHPSCEGLGEGEIPEEELTDPAAIDHYGGYGIDANDDGVADPYDIEDAVFSAANYLSQNGAAEGDLERAIFLYNRSDQYVEDVLGFYHDYKEKHP
ncbi:lytic transglycosylase domain-containing protein [Jeotgalibacillus haloalkalitolerans]|uniref:Lytic transglycosylase domain-containing protein n=1 Tax=Jeotgalibacillus haloalkalitolerans TaxID=3104292 RepID=A0ABU5KL81_9BACL|nr:lytic transglycosylase domain-containing protein [Jeotgalibacillus sp. HH7-29]MDZ5711838.1 lytic transglycosylase domain-containing protein [Jeotgalibacillus sp. HH7-29]